MTLMLEVLSESKWQGKTLTITRFPFLVGRSPECQMRPNSSMVSRRQCALVCREERYFLQDFGSTNGTLLNGRILRGGEIELVDGDQVVVGPLEFLVRIADQAPTLSPDAGAGATAPRAEPATSSPEPEDHEATWANLLLSAPETETVPEAPGVHAGEEAEEATEVSEPLADPPEEERPLRRKAPKGDATPGTPGAVAKDLLKKYHRSRHSDDD
jgi:predicted component of type VI protein secretion system